MHRLCSSLINNGTLVTSFCDENTRSTTVALMHLFNMVLTKVVSKFSCIFWDVHDSI